MGWKWEETQLKDSNDTPLLADDVKQLLLNRGEKSKNLQGKKVDMIEFLKEKYDVKLKDPIEKFSVKQIIPELKLRGLNTITAKKSILIQRMKGEIDATPPPKKKMKKLTNDGNFSCLLRWIVLKTKVYVAVYTLAATADDDNIDILGCPFVHRRVGDNDWFMQICIILIGLP